MTKLSRDMAWKVIDAALAAADVAYLRQLAELGLDPAAFVERAVQSAALRLPAAPGAGAADLREPNNQPPALPAGAPVKFKVAASATAIVPIWVAALCICRRREPTEAELQRAQEFDGQRFRFVVDQSPRLRARDVVMSIVEGETLAAQKQLDAPYRSGTLLRQVVDQSLAMIKGQTPSKRYAVALPHSKEICSGGFAVWAEDATLRRLVESAPAAPGLWTRLQQYVGVASSSNMARDILMRCVAS